MARRVLFYVHAGRPREHVRQDLAGPAVVGEPSARLIGHRPVDGEVHPVVAGLELNRRVRGVAIRPGFIPVQPGGHRQEVPDRQATLAVVDVSHLAGVEEREHRCIE